MAGHVVTGLYGSLQSRLALLMTPPWHCPPTDGLERGHAPQMFGLGISNTSMACLATSLGPTYPVGSGKAWAKGQAIGT